MWSIYGMQSSHFEIYLNLIHAIRLAVITFVEAHFYLGASFLWVYDVFEIGYI